MINMILIKKILKKVRLFIFNEYREKMLSAYIANQILLLIDSKIKNVKILDYGSGMEPIVANLIYKKLINELPTKKIDIDCYDFYSDSNKIKLKSKYPYLNFSDFSKFNNNNSTYDFSLVLDVLHHVDITKISKIDKIIQSLVNKCKIILIKDHIEKNIITRMALILMDFIGNFYNNVKIPSKYFNKETYNNLISRNKLIEIKRITNKFYYKKYWLLFSYPELHFISILKINE